MLEATLNYKQLIPTGTVVYKKVRVRDRRGYRIGDAIISMVVTSPGFIARWEDCNFDNYICQPPKFRENKQNKGRVAGVTVLSVINPEILEEDSYLCSDFDKTFTYEVGKSYEVSLDPDNIACSEGIHCFLTREEAEAYDL